MAIATSQNHLSYCVWYEVTENDNREKLKDDDNNLDLLDYDPAAKTNYYNCTDDIVSSANRSIDLPLFKPPPNFHKTDIPKRTKIETPGKPNSEEDNVVNYEDPLDEVQLQSDINAQTNHISPENSSQTMKSRLSSILNLANVIPKMICPCCTGVDITEPLYFISSDNLNGIGNNHNFSSRFAAKFKNVSGQSSDSGLSSLSRSSRFFTRNMLQFAKNIKNPKMCAKMLRGVIKNSYANAVALIRGKISQRNFPLNDSINNFN